MDCLSKPFPVFAKASVSRAMAARSMSDCERTETYSPAAIDMAPAARPAPAASKTAPGDGSAAATPTISEDTETIPSFAPNTAARSEPERVMKWGLHGRIRR